MFRYLFFCLFFCGLSFCAASQKIYKYPSAPKDSTYDVYFDTTICDPYQWMENPDDPRLEEWLKDQKKINAKQSRNQGRRKILSAQMYTMYSGIENETLDGYIKKDRKNKDKYEFKYSYKNRNRAGDLMCRRQGEEFFRKLVKIRKFQKDRHDHAECTAYYVSDSLDIAAIEISHNGSDWRQIYFFDLLSRQQLPDTLLHLRGSSNIIWDGNGFYYDRYNAPKKGREFLDKAVGQTLCYHKMGTPQEDDKILLQNPDTTGTDLFSFYRMGKGRLFINHYLYSKSKVYRALGWAYLNQGRSFFIDDFIIYPNDETIDLDVEVAFGDTVILKSNWNSPNGKVLMANVKNRNELVKIVPEFDVPLRRVDRLGKDKLACIYRNNGQYSALIYSLAGELLKKIDFPKGKMIKYFYEYDLKAEYTDFCLSSFYHPNLWFQLSLEDFSFKPSVEVTVPYNYDDLETRYVKYKSKDGTVVPMYITCHKDTELNGENPTILHGYGGYGQIVEPYFDKFNALWLMHGGIIAVPNIRGGGAEGSDWGLAGRRLNKQNTIDDFIAAAEFLIHEKYTSSKKLAITGASHGGLLVGAAITQRPELFKAAIAESGAFDMLRVQKFTVGSINTNINEFGTPSKFDDFNKLVAYSPLHNLKEGVRYPNVLLIIGDNDDRVPPLHSYKFLASLQEKGDPKSLYQLYVIPGAGHGGAITPDAYVDKTLFEYYFLYNELGLRFW